MEIDVHDVLAEMVLAPLATEQNIVMAYMVMPGTDAASATYIVMACILWPIWLWSIWLWHI